MTLEENIRSIVREVLREEIQVKPAPEPLLKAEEAGRRLGGLDKQAVYRLVREGALKPVYISSTRYRFQAEEIERFIREGGRKTCSLVPPAHKVSRGGR